jgi:quercetin dioxygenase-like cupin family protein
MATDNNAEFVELIKGLPGYKVLDSEIASAVVQVPEVQRSVLERQLQETGIELEQTSEGVYLVRTNDKGVLRTMDLFSAVSWMYGLKVHPMKEEPEIIQRDEGYVMSRIKIRLAQATMGLFRVIIPPGKDSPAHCHTYDDELFEFYSEARVELEADLFDEPVRNVKPGEWVFVPNTLDHHIMAPPDKYARFAAQRLPYTGDKILAKKR